MNRSATITFTTLLMVIGLNVFILRMVETDITWNLQHLLLRGTLVGVCSCVCIWCCRRRLQPAIVAFLITALAAAIAYFGSNESALFSRIWFAALIIQMSFTCAASIVIENFFDATRVLFENSRLDHEDTRPRWQLSLRTLISTTTAAAILTTSVRWADLNSQTLTQTSIIFGGCGILTAINFRSAIRCDTTTACTVTISICLAVAGLLKLTNLDLQQWLTGTLFTISLQATVLGLTLGRSLMPLPLMRNSPHKHELPVTER